MIAKLLAVDSAESFDKQKDEWINHGIIPIRVSTMHEAIEIVNTDDFVIVGINSDYFDYRPLLQILRDVTPIPINILTSNYSDADKVVAFELGADHYSIWSNDIKDSTIVGIHMIRRYIERNSRSKKKPGMLTYQGIFLYPSYRRVYANNTEVLLTRKEYELLNLLMRNKFIVLEYALIYERIWREENNTSQNALRVLVTKLKQKFESAGLPLDFLHNVHDVGYRLGNSEIR